MAEKEYINREPNCKNCIHAGVCYMQEVCNDIDEQLRDFGCDDFKPTADVVEAVHGAWIETDWMEYDGHGECIHHHKAGLFCSVCRHCFKKELLWKDNFCPNCGAKMDRKVLPHKFLGESQDGECGVEILDGKDGEGK